jgi:hypothetical protein
MLGYLTMNMPMALCIATFALSTVGCSRPRSTIIPESDLNHIIEAYLLREDFLSSWIWTGELGSEISFGMTWDNEHASESLRFVMTSTQYALIEFLENTDVVTYAGLLPPLDAVSFGNNFFPPGNELTAEELSVIRKSYQDYLCALYHALRDN